MIVINKFSILSLLIISLVILGGCENTEESNREAVVNVKKVMAARKQAIENKDMELYRSLILPDYNDGKSQFKEQIEYMQSLFDRYEKIEFTYQKSPVDIKMNSARMIGKISYKPKGAEKAEWAHEITLFRRVEGKWYISGGIALGIL